MTVAEIIEQMKSLSPAERKEVLAALQHMEEATPDEQPEEHWGKALNRLLDEIGPIELVHPEIEDPVEWVKTLRREEQERRLGNLANWGEDI